MSLPHLLRLAACALVGLAAGCRTYEQPPDEPEPPPFTFRVGPGDTLRVSVWGEPELARDLTLGPDGATSFPLIGDVPLVGRTLDEVRIELAQRLKQSVLVDPVVSVSLVETKSHVVHVVGEVVRPGPVLFVRGATALGAIQAAGGYLAATAELSEVCVVRDRMGTRAAYAVDLAAVLAGEARDLWLQPGDVVHVAPRLLARWDRWCRQALPWGDPIETRTHPR